MPEIQLSDTEDQLCFLLVEFTRTLPQAVECCIAGGWVRDKLLGLSSNDIDIALSMMGFPFAEQFSSFLQSKNIPCTRVTKVESRPDQPKHLETAKLGVLGLDLDFVNFRSEKYTSGSRIPVKVEFGTKRADTTRRDFTINALVYNVHTRSAEDPTSMGKTDLEDSVIRTPLTPKKTFLDDPLRVLRCIRFASRFSFVLVPELVEAARTEEVKLGVQDHFLDGIPVLFEGAKLVSEFKLGGEKNDNPSQEQDTTVSESKSEKRDDSLEERVAMGLFLRHQFIHSPTLDAHWTGTILFSLVQELVPLWRPNNDQDLLNPLNVGFIENEHQAVSIIQRYHTLIMKAEELDLIKAVDVPHLLNGHDLATLLGWRPGSWVKGKLAKVMEWQLKNPGGTKAECENWIKENAPLLCLIGRLYTSRLFRKAPAEKPLLFLYRNESCVVIGRNQNPWKEINFPALRSLNIPFLRRRSGGGTVYHDLGNTNYSIHLPRASFDRHYTSKIVQQALINIGINAEINERNDICCQGFKICIFLQYRVLTLNWKHVSGSAYKIVNKRAYHHGTMLITTELHKLGNSLRNTKDTMVTRGVASVRSPVHNLQMFNPSVTHDFFLQSMIAEFRRVYEINSEIQVLDDNPDMQALEFIQDGQKELQSWGWKYGQTPEFSYTLERTFPWGVVNVIIQAYHGLITECKIHGDIEDQEWVKELEKSLVGCKYGLLDEFVIDPVPNKQQDVITWLREEM
ncbi:hypothetical protein Clacol_001353 [Clathrus columnatus]|uniref:Putative lipoate-protein ligase A n=1 Tax=Clathrus columnatus TaxID=1419009 RepID=A0AAV5A3D8_9AGAM|nr:hypothetical protein Clacol_001353 [Clathrus columnatus]